MAKRAPTAGAGAATGPRSADELLAEYMQRVDAGEAIDRQDLLREHPEAAAELIAYFEAEDAFSNIFGDSAIHQMPAVDPPPINIAMVELVEEDDTVDALDEDTEHLEGYHRPRHSESPLTAAPREEFQETAARFNSRWLAAAGIVLVLGGLAFVSWQAVLQKWTLARRTLPEKKANASPFDAGDTKWEAAPGANWTAKNRPGLLTVFEDEPDLYAYLLADKERPRFGSPMESYSGQRCLIVSAAPPLAQPPLTPSPTTGAKLVFAANVPAAAERWPTVAEKSDPTRLDVSQLEPIKNAAEKKEPDKKPLTQVIQRRVHPMFPVAIDATPGPIAFRYLRFAWKKTAGQGILVRLFAADGRTFVYYAGDVGVLTEPAIRISASLPTEWTLVERDVAADFGPFSLNGMVTSMADGPAAYFDQIYLGRTERNFAKTTAANESAKNIVAPIKPGTPAIPTPESVTPGKTRREKPKSPVW